MRKTLGAAALMLAFCCPSLAGEIPNPPAPQPQGMTAEEPTTESSDAADSLSEIVLDLLSVLPSLF